MAVDRADVVEAEFLEQHAAVHSAMQAGFDRLFDLRQEAFDRIAHHAAPCRGNLTTSCFSPV